jgi:hypothetical protein
MERSTYLECVSWHEVARVLEPHGLCNRCHVEQVERPAVIANSKVSAVCRELHSPNPSTGCVIFVLGGGVRRTGPRPEDVTIRGIEEQFVSLGSRFPNDQPPPIRAPQQPLGVDGIRGPRPLQLPCRKCVQANVIFAGRSGQQGKMMCPGPKGEASRSSRRREELGVANLDSLGRCKIVNSKLHPK